MVRESSGARARRVGVHPGTTTVLVGLLGLGVGAAGAVFLEQASVPRVLDRPAMTPGTFTPVQVSVDDARQVTLVPGMSAPTEVTVQRTGIVTGSACAPRAALGSGGVVASVDGRPVIGLASSIPQWQSFAAGTGGSDVEAITTELARLGKVSHATKTLDGPTFTAVATAAGMPGAASLPPGTFVWLPERNVTWASCSSPVGKPAGAVPLGTWAPVLNRIDLAATPSDALPGARMLSVGDASVPVADGNVTDPAALAKVASTTAFSDFQRAGGQTPLAGTWRLTQPLPAWKVPAAAVTGRGEEACVSIAGHPTRVAVVGSTLGQTLVRADQPLGAVDYPAPGNLICP